MRSNNADDRLLLLLLWYRNMKPLPRFIFRLYLRSGRRAWLALLWKSLFPQEGEKFTQIARPISPD